MGNQINAWESQLEQYDLSS